MSLTLSHSCRVGLKVRCSSQASTWTRERSIRTWLMLTSTFLETCLWIGCLISENQTSKQRWQCLSVVGINLWKKQTMLKNTTGTVCSAILKILLTVISEWKSLKEDKFKEVKALVTNKSSKKNVSNKTPKFLSDQMTLKNQTVWNAAQILKLKVKWSLRKSFRFQETKTLTILLTVCTLTSTSSQVERDLLPLKDQRMFRSSLALSLTDTSKTTHLTSGWWTTPTIGILSTQTWTEIR